MKFRKRPVEVDAIQWTGDNFDACRDFVTYETVDQELVQTAIIPIASGELAFFCLKSKRDVVLERDGWIIAEPDGDGFYPCTAAQFASSVATTTTTRKGPNRPPES